MSDQEYIAIVASVSYLVGYIACMFIGWISKGQDESRIKVTRFNIQKIKFPKDKEGK